MLCRGAFSRAFIALCVSLLLGTILIGLFVSRTGSTLTTQPTPWSSIRVTDVTRATGSTPLTQPKQTTSPFSAARSTSGMAISDVSNETTFTVLPQSVSVSVGDTFFVSVFAENVSNMYSWQVNLFFDPTVMDCLNVSLPGQQVFSDRYPVSQALIDYNSTEFTKRPLQSVQNDKGTVLAGDGLLGQNQTTFSGSGFLCQVAFKALSSGSSDIALSKTGVQPVETFYLDDGLNEKIPSFSNGSVTVLAK